MHSPCTAKSCRREKVCVKHAQSPKKLNAKMKSEGGGKENKPASQPAWHVTKML